jgi:hypothetical protein
MIIAARYIAATTLLLTACAVMDVDRIRQMNLAEAAEVFRPCVGPYGVAAEVGKLPLGSVPEATRLEHVELSTSGIVSDGFNHALLLDRRRGVAYIVETGGFAGVNRVYGPLGLRTECANGALRG